MASGRLKIGHGSPSSRSLSAEYGQYNLLGQEAALTVTSVGRSLFVATTGSDSTGDGTIGNPWGTPEFAAAQMTQANDTLYIRGGTYNIPRLTAGRSTAIFPRANNCTIKNYNGESVVLRGNNGTFPTGGVIGCVSGFSGLIVDGITVIGMVMADGNTAGDRPTTFQNMDISLGGDGWSGTNQGAVAWLDEASNVRFYRCRLHDNGQGSEAGSSANNGLFMIYNCDGLVIEECDIYNSSGTGITMKDDLQNAVIRRNWIRNNAASGIWTGNNPAPAHTESGSIYQNIIDNNNTSQHPEHGGIALVSYTSLMRIYNNTFHRNYVGDLVQWPSAGSTVPFEWFNNLHYASRAKYLTWPYSTSFFDGDYLNYNGYNSGATGWQYRSNSYASLGAWQTGVNSLLAGSDANSVTTSPGFLNATGNWTATSDYKRSSYPTNGRGGSYSNVMGAYITGTEQIGAS